MRISPLSDDNEMTASNPFATTREAPPDHERRTMRPHATSLLLWIGLLSCTHPRDDWRQHQDRSIKMPRFDASTKTEWVIDGVTLQALRIAADDFLPPSDQSRQCSDTQAAHDYEVIRDGDIIFIRIAENPERCGRKHPALDGAARYAISTDGRILRRVLDGEPEDEDRADAGVPQEYVELPARPDGGTPALDMSVIWDWSLTPPWLLDGGAPAPTADGGTPAPAADAGLPGPQ
jgi:hypothetical protein